MLAKRRSKKQFQRASDGSMTLIEHFQELRSRLFKASLGVVVGFGIGFWLSDWALGIIEHPYCDVMRQMAEQRAPSGQLPEGWNCQLVQLGATDTLVLKMKISLWLGLTLAAPVWLYQLWAFIAPGLHRHERRWAYWFTAVATPLFAAGAVMAYVVIAEGLAFLLQFAGPNVTTNLEITGYVSFVTNLMLLFGVAFEFPLVIVLFNLAGLASAKRLLGWWRIAVFLTFVFAAVVTPTADPFGMSVLALSLSALYFLAVGFAFLHDRRKERRNPYAGLSDDEISPIEPVDDDGVIDGGSPQRWDPAEAASPVTAPLPLDRRYDDTT